MDESKFLILKETSLRDFRGITREFTFSPGKNIISGRNGAGKTRFLTSHNWLLHGVDSLNKTAFGIRPIVNGVVVGDSPSSVESVYEVNGSEFRLERCYSEVWGLPRGVSVPVKISNKTTYRLNKKTVKTKNSFDSSVGDIISPVKFDTELFGRKTSYEMFKIVTDPLYFAKMDYLDRRKVFGQMEGVCIDTDTIIEAVGLSPFLENSSVNDKQDICTDRQKEITKKLAALKTVLEEHTVILKSANQKTTGPEDAKRKVKFAGSAVDTAVQGITDFKSGLETVKKLSNLNSKLLGLQKDFNNKKASALKDFNATCQSIESKINYLANLKEVLKGKEKILLAVQKQYANQRDHIAHLEASKPPDDKRLCFNCLKPLEESMIAKSGENFNLKRADDLRSANGDLAELEKSGTEAMNTRNEYKRMIDKTEKEIADLRMIEKPSILKIENPEEIFLLEKEIADLNTKNGEVEIPVELTSALDSAKIALKEAQAIEADVKAAETSRKRIDDVNESKKLLSKEFSGVQKILDLIDEYNNQVASQTETIVNGLIGNDVTVRMFKKQENGNSKPVCDILMHGKPYDDLSSGEKVLAGLHIINAMQNHFKLYPPVFIENAESISLIPQMNCQTFELHHVRLFKDKERKIPHGDLVQGSIDHLFVGDLSDDLTTDVLA